jgi:hypothetical protein
MYDGRMHPGALRTVEESMIAVVQVINALGCNESEQGPGTGSDAKSDAKGLRKQ